ncbi:MAG: peptidase, partial [Alphaproteobacteria bacterium]|nr:peptidase [Alphaproteobacteria bacterium]
MMIGGGGIDHFVFSGGDDMIVDFQDNTDTIFIVSYQIGNHKINLTMSDVMDIGKIVNGDAVFDFGHGDILTLQGVNALDLLANELIII